MLLSRCYSRTMRLEGGKMATTNFAQASYQEVIDLNTESDTVSVIGLHTPCSRTPVDMLQGFWNQFRKVRYDGCSFALVPAARLPVDPLGVGYDAGESQIDPRDLLNPILFHGCHGNDMGVILNTLYHGPATREASSGWNNSWLRVNGGNSDSTEQSPLNGQVEMMEALYYKAMTDNTWKKAHPMAGLKKSGLRPMVHDLAVNIPFGVGKHLSQQYYGNDYPAQSSNFLRGPEHVDGDSNVKITSVQSSDAGDYVNTDKDGLVSGNLEFGGLPDWDPGYKQLETTPYTYVPQLGSTTDGIQFMTNRLRSLGWLETQSTVARFAGYPSDTAAKGTVIPAMNQIPDFLINSENTNNMVQQNTIPKIFMGMIMLPPAYKTEQYYRLVINHHFSFKGFRGISMMNHTKEEMNNAYGYVNNMRNVS
ncbi:putative capsid protein [Chimpanzee stool associated circular ssDNA virus]|nr:putative capsid protein [Chimpanzee stool associated circular ssDNA virus]